jgi:hypothetical protein
MAQEVPEQVMKRVPAPGFVERNQKYVGPFRQRQESGSIEDPYRHFTAQIRLEQRVAQRGAETLDHRRPEQVFLNDRHLLVQYLGYAVVGNEVAAGRQAVEKMSGLSGLAQGQRAQPDSDRPALRLLSKRVDGVRIDITAERIHQELSGLLLRKPQIVLSKLGEPTGRTQACD